MNPLQPGTRLGPYEVLGPLGAGGMGEVYRASDPRLQREVAIKIVPVAVAGDPDRLRRFEQESLAAARLNHPNILAVYDVGAEDGVPYVVSELLVGGTLRDAIASGPLTVTKSLDYAAQIARGLAAAHDKGIVHRDLKPENVFVTKDGRVKILDFGLAKLTASAAPAGATQQMTAAGGTEPGMIVGTPGYMSPEQVRGEAADHRSDIFSFALVLYEMLSGQRAFTRATPIETMSAILKEEPPPLALTRGAVPPLLERLIGRCLQKDPDERFQSARDLAFNLDALSSDSGLSAAPAVLGRVRRRVPALAAAAIVVALAGTVAGFLLGRTSGSNTAPSFRRLTFRRGTILSARFAPDGQTIVYQARWQGQPSELFSMRTDSTEARSLGLSGVSILSISSGGEMALRLRNGTLARAPLAGGAPREILENIEAADWSPDGKTLAIVRSAGGHQRLEFPPGKVLYETAGNLSSLTVSADGERIACFESTPGIEPLPSIIVLDLAGTKRIVSERWHGVGGGMVWSPRGNEIWFAGSKTNFGGRHLFAVTLAGAVRELTSVPGNLTVRDMSRDGRLLLEHSNERLEASGLLPGETKERDMGWFDATGLSDLSPDGRTLIITEAGESGFHVFLRKTDGSAAVQLGDGGGFALSPDGRSIILQPTDPPRLALLPTGPGDLRPIAHPQFTSYQWANWFADGKRILFVGSEPGHNLRPYVQDIDGGAPRAIAPEGVTMQTGSDAISPDGLWFAAIGPGRLVALYPTGGGDPRSLPGVAPGDMPSRWSGDGRFLYMYRHTNPAPIYRLDVSSGKKELWKEVGPSDPAGVAFVGHLLVTPDGSAYAYNYVRTLSDLYLADGVK
jgi:serine/threonine protein kinase/Tol biopolymer transport system component